MDCVPPLPVCLLLCSDLSESPIQAFRRHFGKREHLFSQIKWREEGVIFVRTCERGGGGEPEEAWIKRN